jgi:hypothetical protein
MNTLNPQIKEVFSGPHKVRKTAYKTEVIDSSGQPGVSGYRSIENGVYVADVYVTVDLEAIARSLGHRAMGNKSKQSKYLGGFVTVEARNIQHEGGKS